MNRFENISFEQRMKLNKILKYTIRIIQITLAFLIPVIGYLIFIAS